MTSIRRMAKALILVIVPAMFLLGGCRSNAQTGALIGAAAGAAGGYMIGNESDKDDHHWHR